MDDPLPGTVGEAALSDTDRIGYAPAGAGHAVDPGSVDPGGVLA